MGLNLHCDRCRRFVKTVTPKQIKELETETVCASCKKMEEKLVVFAEGLRTKFAKQMELLIKEAKGELKEKLAEITGEDKESE